MMVAQPPQDDLTDEVLMMFADGTLDDDRMRLVERALETDPSVEKRLEAFLVTRHGLRGAFAKPMNEAAPARLLAAALGDGNVVAMRRPAADPVSRRARWIPLALAASLAGVVAGLGGYMAGQRTPAAASATAAVAATGADDLAVLSRLKDGETGRLPGTLVVTPSGTYRVGDQRFCRTLAARHGQTGTAAEAVACRGSAGWRVELVLPRVSASETFLPASGTGPIDALLDANGAGTPLELPEVEALIRDGWR